VDPLEESLLVALPPLGLVVLLEELLLATDVVAAEVDVPAGVDVPEGAEIELDGLLGVGVEGAAGDEG
jgi:hypothetical protein